MREIKFRGFRYPRGGGILSGEWVFGYYHFDNTGHFEAHYITTIGNMDVYKVVPGTVGQFTGSLDKNGKKIYEGDIIERRLLPTKRICQKSEIIYNPNQATFAYKDIGGHKSESFLGELFQMEYEIEVVGNIYENSNLLEVS